MTKPPVLSTEFRWAFRHKDGFLLGRYCLPNATEDNPVIPTFRTRKQARSARKLLRSYRSEARIVKVAVEYWTYESL